MSEFLLFILLMCDDVGLTANKCKEAHNTCVINLTSNKYYKGNAKGFCENELAKSVWLRVKQND